MSTMDWARIERAGAADTVANIISHAAANHFAPIPRSVCVALHMQELALGFCWTDELNSYHIMDYARRKQTSISTWFTRKEKNKQ